MTTCSLVYKYPFSFSFLTFHTFGIYPQKTSTGSYCSFPSPYQNLTLLFSFISVQFLFYFYFTLFCAFLCQMLLNFPLSEIDRKQPFHGPAIPTRSLRVSAPPLSNPRKYNSPCLLPLLPSTCKQPVETSKPKEKPHNHHLIKNRASNLHTLTAIITSKPHKKSS